MPPMEPQPLSSLQNPRVKLARSLTRRKDREKTGLILVEGEKLLLEAVAAGLTPTNVFALPAWWDKHLLTTLPEAGFVVSETLMASISTTDTPTDVVAVFPVPGTSIPAQGRPRLAVVAHQLQDPGNLGTIIRSADAADADVVFVTEGCTDPWSPKCIRATMGACFHVPIVSTTLAAVRENYPDLPLYALALDGAESLYRQDLRAEAAFIIGNEGAGLPAEAVRLAHKSLKIPIPGKAESLNAAMAATVCLFEAVRQRQSPA